jgi:hypothetical protein
MPTNHHAPHGLESARANGGVNGFFNDPRTYRIERNRKV